MECNFTVGQKVVCINSDLNYGFRKPGLKYSGELGGLCKGAVYTVREVFLCETHDYVLIRLKEIRRGFSKRTGQEFGFDPLRFRPVTIRKTDISIFKAMLNPSKEQVSA